MRSWLCTLLGVFLPSVAFAHQGELGWSLWKELPTIFVALIAIGTFAYSIYQNRRQNTQRRAQHFIEMRSIFKGNEGFTEITKLLGRSSDSETLATYDFRVKIDYVAYLEMVALMVHSKVIRKEVADYMFGFYARRVYNSDAFWANLGEKKERAYPVFCEFAKKTVIPGDKDFRLNEGKFVF